MSDTALHHVVSKQIYAYIAAGHLPEDRDECVEITVGDARLGFCNMSKLARDLNKIIRLRAAYDWPRPFVHVVAVYNTGPCEGVVVIAPTVGLGSLVS